MFRRRQLPTRYRLLLFFLFGGLLMATTPAFSQDAEEVIPEDAPIPLVIFNLASVESLMTDIDYMFKTINRPDMTDVVKGILGTANDLGGLDRKKPLGVMLFMKPGVVPTFAPVAYLPTDKLTTLIETMELGPVQASRVAGQTDRYELTTRGQTLELKLDNGYSLISNDIDLLDSELPSPTTLTRSMSAKYDLAISADITAVPEAMRNLFLDLLRAQSEAQLQQRDDEPKAQYEARRAAGMNNLDNLEAVLRDGQRFTIGFNASPEEQAILIDLSLDVTADSTLGENLKSFAGAKSRFTPLIDNRVPMIISASFNATEKDQKVWKTFVESGREMLVNPENVEFDAFDAPMVDRIADSLKATIDTGKIDAFLKFEGQPPNPFVLIGGIQTRNTEALATGLVQVGQELDRRIDETKGSFDINYETHRGMAIHRFTAANSSRWDRRTYGGPPSVHVGAGFGALWFAVGGEDSVSVLGDAIDEVLQPKETDTVVQSTAPFHFVLNFGQWFGLPEDEERRRGRAFRERAKEAFSDGGDQLKFELRPTENGVRWHIRLDEGFIRLIGSGITSQYDRNQI
ncbi:beta/alpha barrel domain-containing protein [Thalassoroseus pseudoceratinae]|uniref:hypothetical protein n=1 Tax=Thalassoroseus pseudoceratinae TaxID=2713176 RepID=UPI00142439BC|nr:hypothetical protein [Thalassoroseus pseudoceratinae]